MIDPVDFIETTLVNPETRELFELTHAERTFLNHAFTLTEDGRLRYPELVFSAPKKSGKTAFAAMVLIFVCRAMGVRYAEGIVASNSLEQAAGRVFQAASRIIEASPLLAQDAKVTSEKITFLSTGATIIAIPSDYSTAAGANPSIAVFDELWGFVSERDTRLWDELVPPPTRQIACRLTVTYSGFEGESDLLADLQKRDLKGQEIAPDLWAQPGMLMFWTHHFIGPWQTEEWREQMRDALRPNAYLRLIENRWVTSEESFINIDWWDECVDPEARPALEDRERVVYVGVDASIKRDSTAICVCAYDHERRKVQLLWHRVFQPSVDDPLDFESTIEATIRTLSWCFRVRKVLYDPWQMQATAQRLAGQGIQMEEFPQTVARLTEAGTNLYELIKSRNLHVYPDAEMRLAAQRSVALETSRGWRISKEKTSHKIDVIIALALAALGVVEEAKGGEVDYGALSEAAARLRPRHPDLAPRPRRSLSGSGLSWPV
jgi:phage terminase large subunit-like protein